MKKSFFVFVFAVVLLVLVVKFHHVATQGFRVNKIAYKSPYIDKYNCCDISQKKIKEVNTILEQDFHYLGRGRQAYVFSSNDNRYVIKFVRFHKYQYPLWARCCSFFHMLTPHQKQILNEQKMRHARAMESYRLAYVQLQDVCQVPYVHLNRTSYLNKILTLYDKSSRRLQVNLDEVAFIIQKKVTSFDKTLLELREKKDWQNIKKVIGSFIEMVDLRSKQGIANRDFANYMRNAGCENFQATEIDVGSFYQIPKDNITDELLQSCIPLRDFIQKHLPQMKDFFEEQLQTKVCHHEKAV